GSASSTPSDRAPARSCRGPYNVGVPRQPGRSRCPTEPAAVAASPDETDDDLPLICARCGAELQPGAGNFYRVTIEAVADPTPPIISAEEQAADPHEQLEQLLAAMEGVSAQEALDQVYRRLTLHLCVRCYRRWIENPVGD